MSLIASIVAFFTPTNIASIVCSLIASLLFEGSKSAFAHIWKSKVEGVDARLRKYFESVIDKLVINEGVAKNLKEKSYEEYLEAVRSRLEDSKAYDINGSLFKDIVDEFAKLAKEDSMFMIQVLFKYQKSLKNQVETIENELRNIADKIEGQRKLLEKISTQITNIEKASLYTIPAIAVNRENIVLPEGFIKRNSIVDDICENLDKASCVVLVGDILVGKTCLAEAVGLAKKKDNPWIVRLNYKNVYNVRTFIAALEESDVCKLLIVDGLPDYDIEILEDFCKVVYKTIKKGINILITSRSFNSLLSQKYGILQYVVPVITSDELRESVPQCDDAVASLMITTSGGYPMLLNLMLFYWDINDRVLTQQQMIDFISIPNKKDVQDYTYKKVREIITDINDLQLLSRLSLFWREFSEEDVITLAGVNPLIVVPKERVRRLVTQRLLLQEGNKLRLSPFIKKVWTTDLLEMEYKECSNEIINRLIQKREIDVFDASHAVMLLCNAKEYDRAGWFYVSCLSKCIEAQYKEASQVSLLAMLWHDMPLPIEMSIAIKAILRITQMQFANMIKKDCSYALSDLVHIIYEFPATTPLKSIASCCAIAQLSQQGKVKEALPLLEYVQPVIMADLEDEYEELLNEHKEISEKLPILMLAGIDNIHELMQWFEKMEQSKMPTESIDALAVKVILNKVITTGEEETTFKAIVDRVKENTLFEPFLIVTVAKWMLFLSEQKRFEECLSVYEKHKDLTNSVLGSILIHNALACCYNDLNETDKALDIWGKSCTEESMHADPEGALFVKITMAKIYCERFEFGRAVECVEALVKNEIFFSALDEYQRMQIHGELAVAYWNNGQRSEAFGLLKIIHDYLYSNRYIINNNYKLLELKFGICVQQYHCYLEKNEFAERFAVPKQTMFYYTNESLLEAYNPVRTGTNIMYLFMMASSLGVDKSDAHVLALRTIECFSDMIKDKNVACGLLNELNPLLLEFNEYEKVSYLTKSSLALAPSMTEIANPLNLVLYLPLLPLCCKRVVDNAISETKMIDELIQSLVSNAEELFPNELEVSAFKRFLEERTDETFSCLTNHLAQIPARIYVYENQNLQTSIQALIFAAMNLVVHKYYVGGLLKQYVYHHSKYIIHKFTYNYRSQYKNPMDELEKVRCEHIDDMDAAKKMIRLMVGFSHEEIQMSAEQENFIGL